MTTCFRASERPVARASSLRDQLLLAAGFGTRFEAFSSGPGATRFSIPAFPLTPLAGNRGGALAFRLGHGFEPEDAQ